MKLNKNSVNSLLMLALAVAAFVIVYQMFFNNSYYRGAPITTSCGDKEPSAIFGAPYDLECTPGHEKGSPYTINLTPGGMCGVQGMVDELSSCKITE